MPSKGKAPKPMGPICPAFNYTTSDADQTLGIHICYNFLEGLRVVSIIRWCECASFQIMNATIIFFIRPSNHNGTTAKGRLARQEKHIRKIQSSLWCSVMARL